jgi:hypothetical protein
MGKIASVRALENLDARGNPKIRVRLAQQWRRRNA